jgi:hypothetical protein
MLQKKYMKLFKKSRNSNIKIPNRKAQAFRKKLLILTGIIAGASLLVIVGFTSIQYFRPLYVSPVPFPFSQVVSVTHTPDTKEIEKLLTHNEVAYTNIIQGTDDTYKVIIKGNSEVILTGKKDLSSQVSSLQVILTRLTMEGKQIKSLDMRFNKPVVVFK